MLPVRLIVHNSVTYLHVLPVIIHNFVQHVYSLLPLRQEVKGRQIGDVHILVNKEITNFRCTKMNELCNTTHN